MTYVITVTIDGLSDDECRMVTEDVREMFAEPYHLSERAAERGGRITVYGEPAFSADDEVEADGLPPGTLGQLIGSAHELPGLGISPLKTPEENGQAFARALGLLPRE